MPGDTAQKHCGNSKYRPYTIQYMEKQTNNVQYKKIRSSNLR